MKKKTSESNNELSKTKQVIDSKPSSEEDKKVDLRVRSEDCESKNNIK